MNFLVALEEDDNFVVVALDLYDAAATAKCY